MNAAENNLIQSLTGKSSLHEATVDELEALAGKYPYFSLGQLLFAKKLKQENSEHFNQQLQYCAVYFPNLDWLGEHLYSKGEKPAGGGNKPADATAIQVVKKESTAHNGVATQKTEATSIEDANLITLPAEDVLSDFTLQMDDVKDEPELPPLDEEELAAENDEGAEEAAAKIADVLQHQVADFKAPVEVETDVPISSEPYHTIDYFASQGIKVDAQPQDAFGKKVHTFTDWLKQMKRIGNYPAELESDPEMESFVQSIANSSNQLKAIETEAMAEVLVKQGKLDKAIEVYEKLSLHNPAKSAYFATKINHLKAL